MAKQIFRTTKDYIDLDRVMYVSDKGHVSMDVHMIYSNVTEEEVEGLVNAWAEWKAHKLRVMAGQ